MSIGATGRSRSSPVSTQRASATPASASAKAQPARTPGHSSASSFTPAAQARKMPALQVPQRVSSQLPIPSNAVNAAIHNAATRTGMDYAFLMAMAAQESTLNPVARAKTSSATGLYQFLDQTWLEQMKRHGGKHGFGEFAEQISKQGNKYVVKDAAARKEILNLRKDPEASALIGAEYSKANKDYLTKRLGREVTPSEVYMAHFLGRGGAEKFLAARDAGRGGTSAAAEFPAAAKANRGIFYDGARARSVEEVYDLMKQKIAPKVDAYQPPKGNYSYTPRFGPGMNSQPGFDWGGGRSSFGFGPHGMAGSGRSNGFGINGLGIGTIGAGGLNSFGIHGGIGMGSTYGRAGGWQFGRGFDFSDIKVAAPSFGSIGISGLNAFGLNGPKMPSGLGSYGVGSIGGSGLTSFGFGPHGMSTSSGGGGSLSSLGIGSIGGSGLSSFGFSSFGSSPLGGGGGGSSFGGSAGGGSFNASGK